MVFGKLRGFRMKKKIILICTTAAFIMLTTIMSAHAGYKGKVVEADTGKSVEGAVILMYWYRSNWVRGYDEFFNAEETLTDSSGNFEIKDCKPNLNPLFQKDEPHFIIFKGGYKEINAAWVISVFKKKELSHIVYFEKDLPVFKLKKVENLSERRRVLRSATAIPYRHRELFRKEINKERKLFNLEPYGEVKDDSE